MAMTLEPCADCGMPCEPGEYHPFAACLMFKACHQSGVVRANLQFVVDHGKGAHLTQPAQAVDDALVEEAIEAFDGKLLETYPDSSFHKLGEGDKAVVRASMRAALTRALAGEQAGWRPIATAPKDGTELWLFCADETPSEFVGFYADDPSGPYWAYSEQLVMAVTGAAYPTHWMPLPASPTPDKETQR